MYSRSSPRRRHDADLKAIVLAACNEPGASVAGVAQTYGLNANLVHKWRRIHEAKAAKPSPRDVPIGQWMTAQSAASIVDAPTFIPVQLPAPPAAAACAPARPAASDAGGDIRIELHSTSITASVSWPLEAAAQCAAWLREVLR